MSESVTNAARAMHQRALDAGTQSLPWDMLSLSARFDYLDRAREAIAAESDLEEKGLSPVAPMRRVARE